MTAIVAPTRAIPVGAVVVSVPPQTVAEAFATVNPTGRVSVKETPVNATVFAAGLAMVKVSEVVAFKAIVDGLKAFAIEGGMITATLADAVPPVPPSTEVTFPVVLFCVPVAVPVNLGLKFSCSKRNAACIENIEVFHKSIIEPVYFLL